MQLAETSSLSASTPQNFSFRNFLKYFGPGLLISIAYLDPGNRNISENYFLNKIKKKQIVSGDLDAGKAAGYHLLWILFLSTLTGYFFQTLSINIGVVTSFFINEKI